jgi:hypothetical protein
VEAVAVEAVVSQKPLAVVGVASKVPEQLVVVVVVVVVGGVGVGVGVDVGGAYGGGCDDDAVWSGARPPWWRCSSKRPIRNGYFQPS